MWGVDPIWAEVKKSIRCSRGTVYRLMREHDIKSKRKKKLTATTNSNHNLLVAPNLLDQAFDIATPNSAWVVMLNACGQFDAYAVSSKRVVEMIETFLSEGSGSEEARGQEEVSANAS